MLFPLLRVAMFIVIHVSILGEDSTKFKPSKRANARLPRILTPRIERTDCLRRRNDAMTKYRTLRKELVGNSKLIHGKDVGMTIGLG